MLSVYRRHSPVCPQTSRRYRRCNCPIWCEGTLEGKYLRHSLKTRSWDRASQKIREMEDTGGKTASRITIKKACDDYVADARARSLREPTIYKFERLFQLLQEFAKSEGFEYLDQLDIEVLRRFRQQWKFTNYANRNHVERLRSLLRFAHHSGWIKNNPVPSSQFRSPTVEDIPTLPFSPDEVEAIVKACEVYPGPNRSLLKAFVLVMRYTGLRIGDVVTLRRSAVSGDVVFVRTAKTGTPIRVPIPAECVKALAAIPGDSEYYFWSGATKPKARVGNFQGMLKTVFKTAAIANGHAHRFRDTFATELLLARAPIEQVSTLLGHKSIRVTEKHYAPWIAARQDQAEESVRRSWVRRTKSRTRPRSASKTQ
jgi:integrase/recombinase XerD